MILPSASQTVERAGVIAKAVVEPDAVALVDETTLSLTVAADAPLVVEPVRFAAQAGWAVAATGEPTTEVMAGRAVWRQTFRLAPERPGQLPLLLPTLSVRAGGRESVTDIAWEPFVVRVATSLTDATLDEARGVTGPIRVPVEPTSYAGWIVAVGTLATLLAMGYVAMRRRRPSPVPSPEAAALARLSALAPLDADGLDAILRRDIERRRGIPAECRTTPEMALEIAADWLELLRRCERAKYAGQPFDRAEWSAALGRAQSLLSESLPVGEENPVTGPASLGKNASSRGESVAEVSGD